MLNNLKHMIDPFCNRPISKVVYHYTSMDSLINIVKEECIRATHMQYLSDFSEFNFLRSVIKESSDEASTEHEKSIISAINDLPENIEYCQYPYVASFTNCRDSLLHWQEYCHNGNGVCIGFLTDALRHISSDPHTPSQIESIGYSLINTVFSLIDHVVYIDKKKSVDRKIALQAISKEYDYYYGMAKNAVRYEMGIQDINWIANLAIKSLSPRVKSDLFQIENEVRIVATTFSGSNKFVEFRPSKLSLIPYINLYFGSHYRASENVSKKENNNYFIKEVIVGPSPNQVLTINSLKDDFNKLNCDVMVDRTLVTFRHWL